MKIRLTREGHDGRATMDFFREEVGEGLEDWGFLCFSGVWEFFNVGVNTRIIDLCWSKTAPSKDWKSYAYRVTRASWADVNVETKGGVETIEMDAMTLDGMYDGMPQTLYVWVEVVR